MKKANKIRIFRVAAVMFALLLAYCLATFSNMPEVSERDVVTMMGIDYVDGKIRVTAHILVPVSNEENKFNQDTAEAEGKDIFSALDKFSIAQGRKVEFSKCGVVVFGKALAERGLLNEVKGLLSANIVSPGIVMLVSNTPTAKEFLSAADDLGEETSEHIGRFINRFENTLSMPMLVVLTFLDGELGESHASFIPCIELEYKHTENDAPEESSGKEEEKNSKTDIASVNSTAVFKEGKSVGQLTADETKGLIFTLPESRRGSYYIDGFSFNGQEFGSVYADVTRKSVKAKTSFENGKPKIRYDISMNIVVDTKQEFLYLFDEGIAGKTEFYAAVAEAFKEKVSSQIEAAITVSRKLDVDYMNLKYRFYRMNNRAIKAYEKNPDNDFLRDLQTEVKVNIKIK